MIGIYVFAMMFAIAAIVYIFPFRKLLWNRWKLKLRKSKSPVFIIFPNNSIAEIVVDTSKDTFTYDDSTYNIRPNKFYNLFGFSYSIYLANNPEPQDLHIDEGKLLYFKAENGKVVEVPLQTLFKNPDGQYVAGKVIDGKTYDNLLTRAYNAGMAWMARNSNLINILLWVVIGLIVITMGIVFWKSGQTSQVCQAAFQNISSTLAACKAPVVTL
jgi:hypothetical protein